MYLLYASKGVLILIINFIIVIVNVCANHLLYHHSPLNLGGVGSIRFRFVTCSMNIL